MADNQPPSLDEALAKYGAQGENSNQSLSIDEALKKYQAPSQPMSGPFADNFFSSTSSGRILSAFGQGPEQEWGAHPNGFSKDQESWLAKNGIINDYSKNSTSFLKSINEAWMRPAATALNTGLGLIEGLNNAGTQIGIELHNKANQIQSDNTFDKIDPLGLSKLENNVKATFLGGLGDIAGSISDPNAGFIPELPHPAGHSFTPISNLPEETGKARASGLIGEGEAGYFNTVPPDEPKMQARQQAAKDAGLQAVPEVKPPVTDVEQVARQINPDVFSEFDRLNNLREDILYPQDTKVLSPAEILENRSKLFDINNQIKDLLPDLNDSVRHAQEIMPTQEQLDNSVIKSEENTSTGIAKEPSTTVPGKPGQGEVSPTATSTGETPDGTPIGSKPVPEEILYRGAKSTTDTGEQAFLSPDRKVAETYAGPKGIITEHTPKFTNLLDTETWMDAKQKLGLDRSATMPELINAADKAGYDGIKFTTKNGTEYVRTSEKAAPLRSIKGTGAEAPLGLSKSLESEFIERGLTDSFGDLPNYNKMVIGDQSAKVAELISSDPDRSFNIAMGKEEPPEGIHPESVWIGVKEQIKRSGDTAKGLLLGTKSILPKSANIMGQRLRLLGEKDPYDPVEAISNVQRAREASVNPKTLESTVKNIKDTVNKNKTPTNWTDFIRSIECDY